MVKSIQFGDIYMYCTVLQLKAFHKEQKIPNISEK